ncbi:hypothetical protein RBH29_16235 [Herbivorax sp. ANBcel31]|uniref:hypothetical protein n=1 Tax=Herbivorax sp. ANBcel31 TaxID=3069754 RepID=UPI0027B21625|nr:hypothetical protein [Herbivorax sp. ANBcel31]MDQ2087979.1 hypothetical protein [Herbivorax sp. ANBcel31]
MTKIRHFSTALRVEYDGGRKLKGEEVLVQLDEPLRKKFETINRLFNGWINSIDNLKGVVIEDGELLTTLEDYDNYYGRYSFKNDDWINFIESLEEETWKALEDLSVNLSTSNWMNLYEEEKDLIQRKGIVEDRRSLEKRFETEPNIFLEILGASILEELLIVRDN